MDNKLQGKKVAILATDGFEQSELEKPKAALEEAGAKADVISLKSGEIKGWDTDDWGDKVTVDVVLADANADDYDALVLPGGVMNPDKLRIEDAAINFVKSFFNAGKPIAAICHGPWTLINAEVVKGKKMTSYPTLRKDLENAGAEWADEEVIVDNGLITSRNPNDIPAFNKKLIEEILEGKHGKRMTAKQ